LTLPTVETAGFSHHWRFPNPFPRDEREGIALPRLLTKFTGSDFPSPLRSDSQSRSTGKFGPDSLRVGVFPRATFELGETGARGKTAHPSNDSTTLCKQSREGIALPVHRVLMG
jgi:hypothetical protein